MRSLGARNLATEYQVKWNPNETLNGLSTE